MSKKHGNFESTFLYCSLLMCLLAFSCCLSRTALSLVSLEISSCNLVFSCSRPCNFSSACFSFCFLCADLLHVRDALFQLLDLVRLVLCERFAASYSRYTIAVPSMETESAQKQLLHTSSLVSNSCIACISRVFVQSFTFSLSSMRRRCNSNHQIVQSQ